MDPGLFPASAANEAADDTSDQWPYAGTMPPDFTAPLFPPVLLHFFHISSSTSFSSFRGELLSQMTNFERQL
jgi:hypothetical protein